MRSDNIDFVSGFGFGSFVTLVMMTILLVCSYHDYSVKLNKMRQQAVINGFAVYDSHSGQWSWKELKND